MRNGKSFDILEMAIVCMAAVFAFLGSFNQFQGDAANSRLAAIYALTEFGGWHIDAPPGEAPNPFEELTIDKARIDVDGTQRFVSSKPPVLTLLMTGEYLLLRDLFGLSLRDPDDVGRIIQCLAFTFAGGGYLLTLIFLTAALRLLSVKPLARVTALFGAAFGTQLWGYSATLNNHVPAAGLLMLSAYLAVGLAERRLDYAHWRLFLFGLTGALVCTIDVPLGVFVVAAGVLLASRFRRSRAFWVATLSGAAIPIVTHCAVSIAATDSILPIQLVTDLYAYPGSYWRMPKGIDALSEPFATYLFHMTFGRFGIFSLYPILLAGLAAGVAACVKPMPHRPLILGAGAAFAVLTFYYAYATNNYGGEAYGFRWYIGAMPVLLFVGALWLERTQSAAVWCIAALFLGVSFYSAWQCSTIPWNHKNEEWTAQLIFGPAEYAREPTSESSF